MNKNYYTKSHRHKPTKGKGSYTRAEEYSSKILSELPYPDEDFRYLLKFVGGWLD